MREHIRKSGVTVNAVAGTHVVLLGFDLSAARRDGCLGFAIQREDHAEDERYWMRGMKTFEETDPGLGPGGQVSSRDHPFQGFQWADYTAKPARKYTYNVTPLYGTPAKLRRGPRVSVPVETEAEVDGKHSVFFNRGAIASQEYTRRFQDKAPDELELPEEQEAAYDWLQRGLLDALLTFIRRARGADFELNGAIYEFRWPEVLAELKAAAGTGARVRVVYDATTEHSKTKNEAAITAARIKGLTSARTTGKLMHNKFFVLSRKGKPVAVWTGSTNLTENGIFGHLNCGHIVEDETVARAYVEYWNELRTNPQSAAERTWMAEHNPAPPEEGDDSELTTVFSPHSGNKVLDWYAEIAGSANDALLMTFAFGMDERFKKVYRRDDDILRIALMEQEGVGRTLKREKKAIRQIRARPNVLVAVGHGILVDSFDRWLAERGGLTNNVEWVHTKFMLVDPLSEAPVVVTGSANWSELSTSSNNENMLVIRGDKRAADIYLGEYMRCYSHHAFREAVAISRERGETAWQPRHLATNDRWQDDYFAPGDDRSARRRYFAQAD